MADFIFHVCPNRVNGGLVCTAEVQRHKTCNKCRGIYPFSNFYPVSTKPEAKLHGICKPCSLAAQKASWLKTHPPKPEVIDTGFKPCTKCALLLPKEAFYKQGARKDGKAFYHNMCKKCANKNRRFYHNLPKAVAKRAENREEIKERDFKQKIKRIFGLSWEEYQACMAIQGNKCAICKSPFVPHMGKKGPHLDHCHETGKVRGILCGKCNTGLGMFKDNIKSLTAAISYLRNPTFVALEVSTFDELSLPLFS